jgi:hypothetical protein
MSLAYLAPEAPCASCGTPTFRVAVYGDEHEHECLACDLASREVEEQGTAAALAAADDALWAATYDPDHEYAARGYRWDPPYGWVL